MRMKKMKYHSNPEIKTLEENMLKQVDNKLHELCSSVAKAERERCASLIDALRDGHEDPIARDILGDTATAIRRMSHASY
jgi:hypothetical protein